MPDTAPKVSVENVNTPGKTARVDAAKYHAMRDALLASVGSDPMTAAEIKVAVAGRLPQDLFPGGATAGWWMKCVQLDLEAKGLLARHATKPLRWSSP